jgi:hypothetical protein
LSRYNVSGCNQSALLTDMYSVGEQFPHGCTTKTSLTRACWVDLDQSATGAFSLVRHLGEKGSPTDILHGLRKHATCKTFNIQLFDDEDSEVSNQFERLYVLKLISQTPDSRVNFFEQRDGFASSA